MANKTLPPRPDAIDDFGIEHWINSHRDTQNGYGYKDFALFVELHVPNTVLGRIFNKSEKTIKDWRRRIEAQQEGQG